MENGQNFAVMECQIWNDDNDDELFNYNSDESEKKYFKIQQNNKNFFVIINKNNEIKWIIDLKEFNSDEMDAILFRMRKSFKSYNYEMINPILENKINISGINKNFLNNKIWFSVKSKNNLEGNIQNYRLNKNDIIKLGRKKYNVLELYFSVREEKDKINDDNFDQNNNISYISSINKNSKPIFNIDIKVNQYKINKNEKYEKINENENKNETLPESKDKVKFITGREIKNETNNESGNKNKFINKNGNKNETINERKNKNNYDNCLKCFEFNSDEENPLIRLCNCKKYIHYKCLKEKLAGKIEEKENIKSTVKKYIIQKFNCEICLKPYQFRFRIPEFNRIYNLIDLILPKERDYICLESLDYIKDNNNIKTFYVVKLNDEEITIGRKFNNDIIDNDVSISREHAVLIYNKYNGNLFLENKSGKFGTLVLVRGNIKKKEKTFFQIGKANFSIEVK